MATFNFGGGATASSTKAVTFNMPSTAASSANTISTPSASMFASPVPGSTAGAPGATTTFSTPAATSSGGTASGFSGFSFPSTNVTSGATGLFGFSATGPTATQPAAASTSAPSTYTFGATSTAPGVGQSTAATTAMAPGFTGFALSGPSTFTTATTAPASSFAFGTSAAVASTATSLTTPGVGGFSGVAKPALFTAATAVGPSPLLTLGGLGSSTVAGGTATQPEPLGLGGVSTDAAAPGSASRLGSTSDSKTVKDSPMPPELVQTVDNFKKHVKEERAEREAIVTSSSCESSFKVQEQVAALKRLVQSINRDVQRNSMSIDKLKKDTVQELRNAETAVQTKEIPIGLQYENEAPAEYFRRLVAGFERDAQVYRQLVEDAESQLARSGDGRQQPLSVQDLLGCLRKTHDTFVLLAAQLHTIHERVKSQKAQYLNYRKVMLHDDTDVFEQGRASGMRSRGLGVPAPSLVGPAPFDVGMSSHASAAVTAALAGSQAAFVSSAQAPCSIPGQLTSISSDTSKSHQPGMLLTTDIRSSPATGCFALQTPPSGSKRGKRS